MEWKTLHGNVSIAARDRLRLERLARYAARPAVSTERLSELPDGRLLYRLKRRWRNGATDVLFERLDFIAKLSALVPAPRAHLVRFHGVLAPAAKWRPLIVPSHKQTAESVDGHSQPPSSPEPPRAEAQLDVCESTSRACRKNYSWSRLLKRVFEIDVLHCEKCGGPVRILAAIHPPETTGKS